MKLFLTIFLSFLLRHSFAQIINSIGDNRVITLGETVVEIPANKVIFTVELQFEDSLSIERAHSNHKQAEQKLIQLLSELNIPLSNVQYSLINLYKREKDEIRSKKNMFTTQQIATIQVDSIQLYTLFLTKLIQNGFTNINTRFASSKEKEVQNFLITKAIESARQKAIIIAKSAKRKLGKVLKVMETEETEVFINPYTNLYKYEEVSVYRPMLTGNNSLITIPQTIRKKYAVKVVFSLL
ncbi:MAG: SIMPL domain-containing protein [Spirosomataceae bacterium]